MTAASRQHRRQPQYPNEDVSLTTQREIRGWYSYGIAAEVFAVCGVGTRSTVLPISIPTCPF